MICYNCFQDRGNSLVCPHCKFNAAEDREMYPTALPAGITLGKDYLLGRVLGQGGFGITYVAQDRKNGKLVAIKEYFPDSMAARDNSYSVSPYSGERGEGFRYGKQCFLEEAKTLAAFIGNPSIVRVYRYFEEFGTAYFVMEYIEGISLKDYLKSHGGKISFEEAKRILIPVMDALSMVHAKGIVHRDISPDNIIITNSGKIKLLDFGAARYSLGDMSRSLDVVLKHGYAPREQYSRHGRQGPFTDVYSLSATFYRSITGIVPQDSIDRMDEDLLVNPRYYCPDLTPQGEFALFKGLAIQPADRFQTTQQLKERMLTTGQVPLTLFRPYPENAAQSAQMQSAPSSGDPTVRSQTPPTPQPYTSVVQQSQSPIPQSFTPPVQQVQPATMSQPAAPLQASDMQPKQKKAFSPLKTTLVSFGISMAVFGVILLIILLAK